MALGNLFFKLAGCVVFSLALPLVWPQGLWLLGLAWLALLATLYAIYGLMQCLTGRPQEAHAKLGVASLEEEIEAGTGKELRR